MAAPSCTMVATGAYHYHYLVVVVLLGSATPANTLLCRGKTNPSVRTAASSSQAALGLLGSATASTFLRGGAIRPSFRTAAASTQSAPDQPSSYAVGSLVEFATGSGSGAGTLALGAITGADTGRRVKVVEASGRTISIAQRDVRHVFPGANATTAADVALHADAAQRALLDASVAVDALEAAWEMLVEEEGGGALGLGEMASLLLGDDSPRSQYVAHAVLGSALGQACFKTKGPRGKELLVPRPPDEAARLRAQAAAAKADRADTIALLARVEAASADAPLQLCEESEAVRRWFAAIERLGCSDAQVAPLGQSESSSREPTDGEACELLTRLGFKCTPDAARTLLVRVGVWDAHENLDLVRTRCPVHFPTHLLALGAELESSPDADTASRVDLTHLIALAIDDQGTTEVDDALGVEELGHGGEGGEGGHAGSGQWRVWVHIADPSRYVQLGSQLDAEARRRGSTVYLPTGAVPMFPHDLSSLLSLRDGESACALSVGVTVDAQGAVDESVPTIITPSLVRTKQLTYEDVDAALGPFGAAGTTADANANADAPPTTATAARSECEVQLLRRLQWIAERRKERRASVGSLESLAAYSFPDVRVKAWRAPDEPDGWGVTVRPSASNQEQGCSFSQTIVSECMMLANERLAAYAVEQRLPVAFRSQRMRPISREELEATPDGAARTFFAIRSMLPSTICAQPLPHEGLGIEGGYVQATSPIRRYTDFALHHQLKAHLRGEPLPFAADEDGESELVRLARDGAVLAPKLERSANEYWLREFLQRRAGQPTAALVLSAERKPGAYKVMLLELGAIVNCRSSQPLEVGARIQLAPNKAGEMQFLPV
jgi:exoribonuclease-2